MKKILIAYFTRFNSTLEAARLIAESLRERDWTAEVAHLDSIRSLDGFDGVIVGAPINGMRWVPEASAFIDRFADALTEKTAGFYCMSYIYFTGSSFWKKAIDRAFDAPSRRVPPAITGIFPGRIDASLPAPMRLIFGIPRGAPLNLFDADAIRAWTGSFAEKLR